MSVACRADGFPLTAMREIRLLMGLDHPNVVKLHEVAVGKSRNAVFLVFEYCEHDMATLIDTMPRPFAESEVKGAMLQLLRGLASVLRAVTTPKHTPPGDGMHA